MQLARLILAPQFNVYAESFIDGKWAVPAMPRQILKIDHAK